MIGCSYSCVLKWRRLGKLTEAVPIENGRRNIVMLPSSSVERLRDDVGAVFEQWRDREFLDGGRLGESFEFEGGKSFGAESEIGEIAVIRHGF